MRCSLFQGDSNAARAALSSPPSDSASALFSGMLPAIVIRCPPTAQTSAATASTRSVPPSPPNTTTAGRTITPRKRSRKAGPGTFSLKRRIAAVNRSSGRAAMPGMIAIRNVSMNPA